MSANSNSNSIFPIMEKWNFSYFLHWLWESVPICFLFSPMTGFLCSYWILELVWNPFEVCLGIILIPCFYCTWFHLFECLSFVPFCFPFLVRYETMSLKSPLLFLSQRKVILPPRIPQYLYCLSDSSTPIFFSSL